MKKFSFYLELYNLSKDTLVLTNDTTKVEVTAPKGTHKTSRGGYAYGTYYSICVNGSEIKALQQVASAEKFLSKLIFGLGLTSSVLIGEDGKERFKTNLTNN